MHCNIFLFYYGSAAADACAPGNPRPASLADFEAMFRKLMQGGAVPQVFRKKILRRAVGLKDPVI